MFLYNFTQKDNESCWWAFSVFGATNNTGKQPCLGQFVPTVSAARCRPLCPQNYRVVPQGIHTFGVASGIFAALWSWSFCPSCVASGSESSCRYLPGGACCSWEFVGRIIFWKYISLLVGYFPYFSRQLWLFSGFRCWQGRTFSNSLVSQTFQENKKYLVQILPAKYVFHRFGGSGRASTPLVWFQCWTSVSDHRWI